MERSTPEELLKKIELEKEMQDTGRGHLKIFFGYAAGVGKTYAMLKAAHDVQEKGTEVVAGYVEPHTRPDTIQLLDGLEVIPPLRKEHKGITVQDFDLDRALKRHPRIILVDELAHTNAEGCRHTKRYQDIEELLEAGIDVYTTVNVQHLESLNDIVASITGIIVKERIPDKIFDRADQVELVDIEPSDLIQRLKDGKIYRPAQVQKALLHFFTVENLTALREIALRRCADRVNRRSEQAKQASGGEYYTDEHIMVCLSGSPSNSKSIRTASRMATAFKGSLTALFVETPEFQKANEEDKKRLQENVRIARQLGAKIEIIYGEDIALQIASYAKLAGVSKLVIGRSNTKRRAFFGRPSFVEHLTECAPDLDIYVIPEKTTPAYKKPRTLNYQESFSLWDTCKTLLILVCATLLGYLFHLAGFSEANIIMVYIMGVLLTAIFTRGRLYSLISSIISVLAFNFFFTFPKFTFNAYDSGYPVTFLIMLLAAFLTSSLAVKIKRQAAQASATAYRTKILLETNQLLQRERDVDGIVKVTSNQLIKLLNTTILFYTVKEERKKRVLDEPQIFGADVKADSAVQNEYITDNERAVAEWTFEHNKHAGATTDTLGSAKCLYLAIRGTESVYGVVGIAVKEGQMDSFEYSLILSIIGECGLAMEKDLFALKKEEASARAQKEELRANLLRSISHDLRTPLTSISGNAGVLLNSSGQLAEEKKKELYTDIYDDSMWLISLVENLLSVTRIEDGTMKIQTQMELMEEVITEAMRHINRKCTEHTIEVRQQDEFILAKMDVRLIMQVLINLIDNAIKYTPPGSVIVITTRKTGQTALVEVADNGPGIADDVKERVFDMFYTANKKAADSRRSLGLGLALCKSIITAHGGVISVGDNKPHGTVFRFTLPAKEADIHE